MSKDTPEEEVFETIYHEFPGTFTTNLAGSRKMLQVGVGVSTQYDDTVMMNVESHQLALRSVILGVISDFSEEDVKGATGRDKLAVALRDAINGKLEVLENFGGVEEVHFTSFVLNRGRGNKTRAGGARIGSEVGTWHRHANSAVMKSMP